MRDPPSQTEPVEERESPKVREPYGQNDPGNASSFTFERRGPNPTIWSEPVEEERSTQERRVAVSSHTVKNAKLLGALAEFVDKRGLNARFYAEEIKGHVEDDPRVAYHALRSKEQQRLSVMYLRALSCHERTELILRPLFEAKILKDAIWPSDLSIFLCDPMLVDRVMDYVMAEESKGWRDCLLHWAMTLAQNCEDAVQTDLEVEKWEQMEPDSSLDPERLLFDRHEAEAINRGSR